jgi:hypothetical protein
MPRELGTVQYDTARAPQPPDSPALGVGEAVIDPPPASSNCPRLGNGSLHPDSGSTSSGYMVFSFSRSRLQLGILFVWGHPDLFGAIPIQAGSPSATHSPAPIQKVLGSPTTRSRGSKCDVALCALKTWSAIYCRRPGRGSSRAATLVRRRMIARQWLRPWWLRTISGGPKGSTSGATRTPVVNLKGKRPPLGKVSSIK